MALTFDLLGANLLEAALWLDVRKAQAPARSFGAAPAAAWAAFRKRVPLDDVANESETMVAAEFLRTNLASAFYTGAPPPGDLPQH